jgi:hypothetical protein
MTPAPLRPEEIEALLPCPFCGNKPAWIPDDSYGDCQVLCQGCDFCFTAPASRPEEAVALWNRRPEVESLRALLGRADAVLQGYRAQHSYKPLHPVHDLLTDIDAALGGTP